MRFVLISRSYNVVCLFDDGTHVVLDGAAVRPQWGAVEHATGDLGLKNNFGKNAEICLNFALLKEKLKPVFKNTTRLSDIFEIDLYNNRLIR